MLKLTCIALFSCAFLIGCGNEHKKQSKSSLLCDVDTTKNITTRIKEDMIRFNRISQVKEINGKETIITYNGLYGVNSIQFLDIKNGSAVIPNVKLPEEGNNAFPQITSFDFHNKDSIFVINQRHIGIVNTEGKVLMKQPINRTGTGIDGIDFSNYSIIADYDCPIYYHPDEQKLYVGIRSSKFDMFHDRFYEGAIAGRLNISNMRFENLPIYYPKHFKTQRFGTLRTPNITFMKEKIVYNFQYASKIYVYDKKHNGTEVYECKSEFTNNEAPPLEMKGFDQSTIEKYSAMNSIFFRMNYDPYRKLWYRTHFSQNYAKQNGVFGKNESFLTCWDQNYNKVKEIKLSWNLNPFVLFITKESLLLHNMQSEDENILHFKSVQFRCK